MEKTLATTWANVLDSGKYEQGQGALKDGNKFCCLGVLCEILKIRRTESDMYIFDEAPNFANREYLLIPSWFCEKIGLPTGVRDTLMEMNDGIDEGNPQSFSQIAQFIRAHLVS
jgi:hypothetical protein